MSCGGACVYVGDDMHDTVAGDLVCVQLAGEQSVKIGVGRRPRLLLE